MHDVRNENLMRAAFAPARALEPSAAQLARVVAETQSAGRLSRFRPSSGWQRLAAPGLAVLVLLAGGLYAVPLTRAAIDDVVGTVAEVFSGYSRGEESGGAPGRALAPGETRPDYFHDLFRGRAFARDQRVLAEAGGYKLFVYRAPSGSLSFDLGGTGVGMGFDSAEDLGGKLIFPLGPGSLRFEDENGHVPFFGLLADVVESVEVRYEIGPPHRIDRLEGGFVLLVEPVRGPLEVVAFDAQGEEVAHQPIDYPDGEPGNSWERYVRPSAQGSPQP